MLSRVTDLWRVSERMRALSLAGLAVAVLAGCGSSASSGTGTAAQSTSGSTTGAPSPHPITSASVEVSKLLALGKPGTSLTGQGTVPGWPPANGSGVPATPSEVSGFGFVADKARNDQYLSFAVMDTAQRCTGGDLETNTSGTQVASAKPVKLPAKAPCTGDEVAKLVGHQ